MSLSPDEELALRRKLLIIDAQLQRLRLGRDVQALGRAADPAVLGLRLWRRVSERPAATLMGLAAAWLNGRRPGWLRWAERAQWLWSAWRRAQKADAGPTAQAAQAAAESPAGSGLDTPARPGAPGP